MGAKPQDDIFTFLHTIDFLVFFVFPQQCLCSATLLTSFPYISNFYYLTPLYYALSFYSSICLVYVFALLCSFPPKLSTLDHHLISHLALDLFIISLQ